MARIAIVGAGPAGASAGTHLAARGHAVTLIDRTVFPRPKTCGDWITVSATEELEALGIRRADLDRWAASRARIASTHLVAPSGARSRVPAAAGGCCIPRLVLDHALWRRAVDRGCLAEQRLVRHIDAAFDAFDFVIDARGVYAGAANGVALRAYWTVPRALITDEVASAVQLCTDRAFRRGYGWVFPVEVEADVVRFNIGVGLWAEDSARGHSIADFHARFTGPGGPLSAWRDAAQQTKPEGHHVAMGRWRQTVAERGVLRIGDAANLADPLTGDGIGNALKSGRLVAEVVHVSRHRVEAAARWQAMHDQQFRPDLQRAIVLRETLTATMAKNAAAAIMPRLPSLQQRLHAAIFGETRYHLER